MKYKFFSVCKAKYLTVSFKAFICAVELGDDQTIDGMLEAKKHHCKLDINGQSPNGTALEIALENRDFRNAGKLMEAGAETKIYTKKWVSDDGCYPYGQFEYDCRDLVKVYCRDSEVSDFLRKYQDDSDDEATVSPRMAG